MEGLQKIRSLIFAMKKIKSLKHFRYSDTRLGTPCIANRAYRKDFTTF